jgi:hypothetical protein
MPCFVSKNITGTKEDMWTIVLECDHFLVHSSHSRADEGLFPEIISLPQTQQWLQSTPLSR